MAYLTNLFSPETYEAFSASSRDVTGFPKSQRKTAAKVSPGDLFICYMTKLSRWVGVLKVVSGPYEDDTPIYAPENDPYVIRFDVDRVVWLPKEKGVPIHEDHVWHNLSFTHDLPKNSTKWTGKVRRSLVELSPEDGSLLVESLRRQAENGIVYPVDESEYQKHLPKHVRGSGGLVAVSVPEGNGDDVQDGVTAESEPGPRESHRIQGLLGRLGQTMGFKVWIPKGDRSRVDEVWSPQGEVLLDKLPLNYDEVTLQTIEQIDVIWLKGRAIARAFEVEHTTAVYSGILRMADLLALQPNMDIKLHIVAPFERKDKVMSEIRRPVFSLLDKGPLYQFCSFLSYDSLDELAKQPHLAHTSDSVLEEYEEEAAS